MAREGRRVYVRMPGPEYLSDDELLRRSFDREDEIKQTVRELEREATELMRERDEARGVASDSRDAYEELTEAYRELETAYGEERERAAHGRTRSWVVRLGVVVAALVVLLVISILVAWRPFI